MTGGPLPTSVVGHDFDDAFPALFHNAYRVAYRLLGDREDAADVAQAACARACARWRRLTRTGDPAPWVVRVAGEYEVRFTGVGAIGAVDVAPASVLVVGPNNQK